MSKNTKVDICAERSCITVLTRMGRADIWMMKLIKQTAEWSHKKKKSHSWWGELQPRQIRHILLYHYVLR